MPTESTFLHISVILYLRFRDIACIELVQQIVEAHPHLSGWEPKKLAIYEKSWQPGKTSRGLRSLSVSSVLSSYFLPSLTSRTHKFQNTKSFCICYYLARLRRLNDFDCPLLLAQHWQVDDTNLDASSCAKTLILQESQNGDIPVKYIAGL